MPNSLYATWRQTVARSPDTTALIDARSGERFSFSDLQSAAQPADQFPSGHGPEFILKTIACWREGLATYPLERDVPRPDLSGLPPGIAHVKTTSGSTGAPRLILFDAVQLAADADNIVATMGLDPGQPNIAAISLAHSYGFSNLVLPLLLHGIPLVLAPDPLPGSFARALTFLPESGGTVAAVPAMWRAWLKADCIDPLRIRTAISAGAPLTTTLETAIFEQTGVKVRNFYGSSECGGIAFDGTPTPRENPDSVGTALRGVEVTTNAGGCITVTGPAVGTGYWPDPDPTTLSDGQFTTQDLAAITSDGTIQLRGRAGDLINIAGRKLAPSSIEIELLKHPSVDHCIVFGIPSPDPERVQEIVAITNAGDTATLRSHLSRSLPAWQTVRHWWITPELQPDSRGKLARATWQKKWSAANQG